MLPSDLPVALARALEQRGYADLTPVQLAVAKPETLARDLLVSARTGSGKTVAYGLALAQDLLGATGDDSGDADAAGKTDVEAAVGSKATHNAAKNHAS